MSVSINSGADPGFQVSWGALKKIAPSGGRRENCWGISCEKSRFYAKKSYCFPILGIRTQDLQHSRLPRQPLSHRCSFKKSKAEGLLPNAPLITSPLL
jgi:hypothetical protein